MLNDIADTKQDFDRLATMFNDSTWSYENMRNYFKLIEHNLYFNSSNPDHGFNGWLNTSLNPTSILANPQFAGENSLIVYTRLVMLRRWSPDPQFNDIINTIAASGPALNDTNSAANVESIGVGNPSYTIDGNHNRSSVRDRIIQVQQSSGGKLTFSPDTLATKVALCDPGAGGAPTAYGVEIAVGAALPVANNFYGKTQLKTTIVTARHEVIVSAGVFQSPQLVCFCSFLGISLICFPPAHGIDLFLLIFC